jgi:hypothetical protein
MTKFRLFNPFFHYFHIFFRTNRSLFFLFFFSKKQFNKTHKTANIPSIFLIFFPKLIQIDPSASNSAKKMAKFGLFHPFFHYSRRRVRGRRRGPRVRRRPRGARRPAPGHHGGGGFPAAQGGVALFGGGDMGCLEAGFGLGGRFYI